MNNTNECYWKKNHLFPRELLDFCKNHVTAIIPTLNEEKSIAKVIEETKPYVKKVIICDGHSKDQTREVAKKMDVQILLDDQKGKGQAMRQAVDYVDSKFIVFIDADMSHNPHDIPALINPLKNKECELVVATRLNNSEELYSDWKHCLRRFGSFVITKTICVSTGKHISDSQNGFRAISKNNFLRLNLTEDKTTIEQEMTIKALKLGFNINEVASFEHKRAFGNSKINLITDSYRYIYSWLKYLCF